MKLQLDRLLLDPAPIVLIEGTRAVPASEESRLRNFASDLARCYPDVIFRTGNATGSDELFAEGIISVDPSRLQYVLPYVGHRKAQCHPLAYTIALSEVSAVYEETVAYQTKVATPANARVIEKRNEIPHLRSKARYLMRDTLKVMGSPEKGLAPATLGIFYVNPSNPEGGGTGHTIRVCRLHNVPVLTQLDWI